MSTEQKPDQKKTDRHHHRVTKSPAHPPIRRYAPSVWHRDHRYALAAIIAATGLTVFTGFLGPSAVTLTLGPRVSALPPWYLPSGVLTPNEWVVSGLVIIIILLGAIGLWVGFRAIAGGWQPDVRRLFGLGTGLSLVTILVPPLTSADVLIYAGYGRLTALGRDPYDVTIGEVIRSQFDPVMEWVEQPWYDTPSVYGPILTQIQLTANWLGGENMHDIVFWLQLASVVPFIIASAIVVKMASGDPARQARATLFSVANPMLIWAVVAGAHNEALAVMFALGGLWFIRRNPFLAGIGIGLAGCTKLSIGIWGLAMLWAYRRDLKKAALLCLGTLIPMGLAYVVWQPTAFGQVLRNGTYVSVGSWANPVYRFFELFLGEIGSKAVVGVLAYGGLVVIAWMLSKVIPWTAAPGLARGADPRLDPLTVALRTSLILSVAWLVTAMYTLAWYDMLAWMPLALAVASKLDRILLLRITLLSLAFVPGRVVDVSPQLEWVATRMHDTVSPIVQIGVIISLIMWWKKPDREELFPFRNVVEPAQDPVQIRS